MNTASAMVNPAESFEPYRRRLLGLAYRMLGSLADAEDVVQDTYLRWHRTDREQVTNPRAFLMTTTTRLCLDVLTSARARREEYVGQWLPEPVVDAASLAPDTHTELAEDLSVALLLALDRLSPLERAAFLLHDVFDFTFAEVADALDRGEAACRQLASRARAHVREVRPRGVALHGGRSGGSGRSGRSGELSARHAELLKAFATATQSGDLSGLTQLLASDVRVISDGGGKVAAAMNVIHGADHTARFLIGTARKGWRDGLEARLATINDLPGVIYQQPAGPDGAGAIVQTTAFEFGEDGRLRALYIVRNPDKLRHLAGLPER